MAAQYLDLTGLRKVVQKIKTPTWTKIWDKTSTQQVHYRTPFIDTTGAITKVERRLNENDNYVWKISVTNTDSVYNKEYALSCSKDNILSYAIFLQKSKSGTFTIELPKNQPNWYFTLVVTNSTK